jgi:hypothetical protein
MQELAQAFPSFFVDEWSRIPGKIKTN